MCVKQQFDTNLMYQNYVKWCLTYIWLYQMYVKFSFNFIDYVKTMLNTPLQQNRG